MTGMTAAELRIARSALGMSLDELGWELDINPRKLRKWENPDDPSQPPAGVAEEIIKLYEQWRENIAIAKANILDQWESRPASVNTLLLPDVSGPLPDWLEIDDDESAFWHAAWIAHRENGVRWGMR